MAATAVALAKLSRPRLGKVLARQRLFDTLDRMRESPVVWVAAQPGAGKTTLLASYLEARKLSCIWYQVDAGDADPASFFYHLGLAAQNIKRKGGKAASQAPLPLFTPEYRADLPGFSRRYFRELYARMGPGSAIVLDNLHEIAEDMPLHRVLIVAFEEVPDGIGLLVASRGEPPGVYAPLIARERFVFIDPSEICLTLEETREIADERAHLDGAIVRRLHEQSGGWAAGLTLLIERARRGETLDTGKDAAALQHVFAYFAEQLLTREFSDHIDTLLQLAFLPRVTQELALALTGDARAGALLDRLHRRHLFTERRMTGAGSSYEFHALLRTYLQHKAAQTWPEPRLTDVNTRAAALLETQGQLDDALPIYIRLRDWPAVTRAILARAQPLLAQGRREVLIDWIARLPEEARENEPWLRYWCGTALAIAAPRDARVELSRAHAGFRRAGNRVARILAAAGVVLTYYLDLSQLRELDPWLAELLAEMDAGVPFPSPAMELHVWSAIVFACDFRQPDPRRLDSAAQRMGELLDADIGVNEKVAAAAILFVHLYQRGRVEDGSRLVARMQPFVEQMDLTPANRALWNMHLGWFACFRGDVASAFKSYEAALRICEEHGVSVPVLDVYTQFGLAFASVIVGDYTRAEAYRAKTERHWKSFRRMDVAAGAMVKGLIASNRGERDAALAYAREHLEVATEVGVEWQIFYGLMHCCFAAADLGMVREVAVYAQRAREMVADSIHARFAYQADLMEAYANLVAGDRESMREPLARGLAASRDDAAKFFLRVRVRLLSRLFAAALDEGIEADLVRRAIRDLRIAPPESDVENWPWPLTVRTLGGFEVRRDGQPLEFSRKSPKKTLALLKAIIAAGGTNIPEVVLLEALWADEEGDAASKSLGAAVLRLRTLLGDPDAVSQQAGTLSVDRSRVWVDAWAFEQALGEGLPDMERASRVLALYRGGFLPEEEGTPWAVPMRERLRARYIHRLGELGARLEQAGRHEEAIEWYLRGLDADSIVEPFYQGLMRCYHRLDRRAEAASTYRRLKQILSVTLGLAPSATTEKLYQSLRLG
jgi:LuxR family maltose regulon positive regulatory protein